MAAWKALRTSTESASDGATMARLSEMALTTGTGVSTANPLPPGGPPSAWIDTATSACSALAIGGAHVHTRAHPGVGGAGEHHARPVGPENGLGAAAATSKLKACSV